MRPDARTAAAWLERLAADRLIVLSPRLVLEAERLLRLLQARGVEDPAEIGDSLASLLAKDEERWRQVLEHFRRTFDVPVAPEIEAPARGAERPAETAPPSVPSGAPPSRRPAPARPRRAHRPRIPVSLRRLAQRIRGRAWAAVIAALVIAVIAALPIAVRFIEERYLERPAVLVSSMARFFLPPAPPPPSPKGVQIELRSIPERRVIAPVPADVPGDSALPGPAWLRWLLACASALLGAWAVRWWFAERDYANDVKEAERRSEEARAEKMSETSTLGVPYHIERAPPLPAGAIEDAATLLGRMTRREEGFDLDVPATIDRTIEAGNRVIPVFSRGGHREVLLIFVDVEGGSHPYLDGVEWVLDRWKRLGVPFLRYDYRERPTLLLRHPDGRPIALKALGRRAEGLPLLIVSRMALPEDYRGRLGWLGQLDPWPNRAWLDLDPRTRDERSKEAQRALDRLAARLPRWQFTRDGLLECAAALAAGGQKRRAPKEQALPPRADIKDALWQWAAVACCVPDPSWAHLDSLRRALPEIAGALPEARSVQLLIDYVHKEGYAKGEAGLGPNLVFRSEARLDLLARLRRWGQTRWPAARAAERLEPRARLLLMRQLQAADVRDDRFEQEKRDMKVAMHEAVLRPEKVEQLLAEYADSAVAPELRALLEEELRVQEMSAAALGGGGWTAGRETAAAWIQGGRGVRLGDLARFGRWGAGPALAAAAVIAGALGSWTAWWWTERRAPPPPPQAAVLLVPPTWRVTVEAPEIALTDVAPMRFVRLPGGSFLMGSPKEERDRDEDERQHPVEVGPFELSIHEVTQRQWSLVMGTKPFNCDYGCGDDLPAQNVSWEDAVRFMNALTDRENRGRPAEKQRTRCYNEATWSWNRGCTGYRLPTEAEWEYAARAGTTTAYSFGDDPKERCAYANGADQATKRKHSDWIVNEACDDKYADLAPVGKLKPNGWGLYDMYGNVWEWVWDEYGPYPERSDAGYAGPDGRERRVLRGGSFVSVPRWLRSSVRFRFGPTYANGVGGFRCARGTPPSN